MQWFVDYDNTKRMVRVKSVRVILNQNNVFRQAEVQMPLEADPDDYITANVNTAALWSDGTEIPIGSFFAARERNYREYYFAILQAIEVVRISGGDIDAVRAAGLQAIAADNAKATEFASWRNMLQLSHSELNLDEKRLLLLGMIQFATTGLESGR